MRRYPMAFTASSVDKDRVGDIPKVDEPRLVAVAQLGMPGGTFDDLRYGPAYYLSQTFACDKQLSGKSVSPHGHTGITHQITVGKDTSPMPSADGA